jgi:tRNA threonylcarbamoyl adenosine modification protein YeaZ
VYNINEFGSGFMKTLFISTYNEIITIGLLFNDKLKVQKQEISSRNHSIYTVPLIDETLKEANINVHDLDEILVINGPGSFTGVRLGITVAKTLAYTLKIPIKEISSLEALSASNKENNKIVIISDSKGKYYGIFANNKLIEMNYLADDDFELIKNKPEYQNYAILETKSLDIESINEFAKDIKETPAHAVKALYIKGISALNG